MLTKDTKLRFWCQKVLPLVYDDSLSYYELLNKVVLHLNKHTEDINELINFYNTFSEDLEEIIRQMIEDGEFNEIIANTIGSLIAEEYDPNESYIIFDYCIYNSKLYRANGSTTGEFNPEKWDERTVGYDLTTIQNYIYSLGAGNVSYDGTQTYASGTVGNVIKELYTAMNDYVTPEMFGATADGTQNDTTAILAAYNYAVENNKELHFNAKSYVMSSAFEIRTRNVRIIGEYPRTKIIYTGTGNLFDVYEYPLLSDSTFEISGFVIRTTTGENGFYIRSKMYGLIKDIDIKGFKKNFYLHGNHAIHYLSFINIYSDSASGNQFGYGIYFYSDTYAGANSCYFNNCRFAGYDGGLYMRGASALDPINNVSFVNCCFEQDHNYIGNAVDCDNCSKIVFIGCRFEGASTHKVKASGYNYFIGCSFFTLEQDISANAVVISGRSNINTLPNIYLSLSPIQVLSELQENSELINTSGTGGKYIIENCNGDTNYYGQSGSILVRELLAYDANKWARKVDGRFTCTEFRIPIISTFSVLQQYADLTDGITVLFTLLNCIITRCNNGWYKQDGTRAIVNNENISTYYPYPAPGTIVLNTSLSTSVPCIYTGSQWQLLS